MKCGILQKKKQNKLWLWIAFDRERYKPIAFVLGCRSERTGKKLWEKIKEIDCNNYATDDWKPYTTFLPIGKHSIGKEYTHFIESFNCNVRHYLARFRRKTRCYSKCKEMVEYSLYLLFWKDIALSMF